MDTRYALVTGGLGDIGGAIVSALSADGFEVVVLDLSSPSDDRRAEDLRVSGRVHFAPGSTTEQERIQEAIRLLPRIDVAVLCAGIVHAQPFLEIEPAEWARQLEVNLTGAFLASQAAARNMVETQTTGHLIYISSWVAARPWPEIAAYSSSKAGINQLMRTAALELSPYRIRANAVAPGIVMAGLARGQFENEPQYRERASRSIPLGEPQTPEEIADAVRFLASPAAATITGTVLTVDSGCTLGTLQ